MLPDWDFGRDDGKRREFIEWAWCELDRFAVMTTERFIPDSEPPLDWLEAAKVQHAAPRPVGAPAKGDALRASDGMEAALWDYMLLQYMFRRYWPGRKRRMTDRAHAAQIATQRNWRELSDTLADWDDASLYDKALTVHDAFDRCDDTPGRRMANADKAYLDMLPSNLFAR